ncbi:MAG: response regulator, partial [Methylococcaceae bacterium]
SHHPTIPPSDLDQSGNQRNRLRLMVVDDHQDGADSLSTLLQLFGATVEVAYSTPLALERLPHFMPDAIFLDIGMPDISGTEVAQLIRRQDQNKNLLLVALTGWTGNDIREESKSAGFDHHYTKPINLCELEQLLHKIRGSIKD